MHNNPEDGRFFLKNSYPEGFSTSDQDSYPVIPGTGYPVIFYPA
jgi:hypothetical protein